MIKYVKFIGITVFLLGLVSCKRISIENRNSSRLPDHRLFDSLLFKYVDDSGKVNYKGLIKNRDSLEKYLLELTNNLPNDSTWTHHDKIAYWINLYNAFTLKLIIDNYPVVSIKDIGNSIQVPFVNTPWDIKFILLNGEKYDLNNIEHNILRKMREPRIHFSIVCASISCPNLRREAYTGDKLEGQLKDATSKFLSDKSKNDLKTRPVKISKIFKWFKGDFTQKSTLLDFVNDNVEYKIPPGTDIEYLPYDWGLNEQKTAKQKL